MRDARVIAAIALLIASSALSVGLASRRPRGSDDLTAVEGVVDLGKVPRHHSARGEYVLVNDSDETIHIDHVYTGCSCTVPDRVGREAEPGQSVRLGAAFHADDKLGPRRNFIVVNYRSAGGENYRSKHLLLLAEVVPEGPAK